MNKKKIAIALLSLISLASCSTKPNTPSNTPSAKPSAEPSKPSSPSKPSTPSASVPAVVPPVIDEAEFSYLLGDYYAKGSKAEVRKDSLVIESLYEEDLTLIPSAVSEVTLEYDTEGEEPVSYDTLLIEFASKYNNGTEYQAYINFDEGLLYVEKLMDDNTWLILGSYMPDIQSYSGVYSAYGDGSSSNMYLSFDGEFDLERGVYPAAQRMRNVFSDEQTWYIKSYAMLVDGECHTAISLFDEDDYGYGKNLVVEESGKIRFLDGLTLDSYDNFITDVGGFNNLTLFDGTKNVTTSLDMENKTFTFDGETAPYETRIDENGFHLAATFNGKEHIFSIGDYQLNDLVDGKTVYYPYDTIRGLQGSFQDSGDSYGITLDDDGNLASLKVNGSEITDYSFVVHNKRKSIKFTKDGKEYILSPDKLRSSIRLEKDGQVSYPINEDLYRRYYSDTFISHEGSEELKALFHDDLSFEIGTEKGKGTFRYWHGDKYPTVEFRYQSKDCQLSLVQSDIGFYVLTIGSDIKVMYTKTVLDKVYDTYSANGKDDFVFDDKNVRIKDQTYTYSFDPYYQPGTGTYAFAIRTIEDDKVYQNNLHGSFISGQNSYIRKSLFASLYGTYSGYGKYGIENIKFLDGRLYLDTNNSDRTGLIRDVEFTYTILTNLSDEIMLYFDLSDDVKPIINFRDGYVEIMSLDYYRNELVQNWGTYADENDTVYFQDDKIYLNGTSLTVTAKQYDSEKAVLTAGGKTFTFTTSTHTLTLTDGNITTTLSRKFKYEDYEKFFGTYTINGDTITFQRAEYLGYTALIGTNPIGSFYITKREGKYSLAISYLGSSYYLMLDEETGEISTAYESSIPLPPLPPAPPLSK